MQSLGPAIRPGSPVKKPEPTKKKGWSFRLFSKKKKSKRPTRVEPPVVSQPVVAEPAPTPKKRRSLFSGFGSLFKSIKLPKLSAKSARPDPAPSRARYIWSRLMLRPRTRLAIVKGVPTLGIVAVILVLLSNQGLREDISETYTQLRDDIIERPELYVQVMQVNGASQKVDRQVRLSSGLSLPASSFEIDLLALRTRLERLDAVKSASVFLRAGGVLQVDIEERIPVALWRGPSGLETIDIDGVRTAYVERRSAYPGLPLIVGSKAKPEVGQALQLLRDALPIADRIRALSRVSERRWNVILTNDTVVKLPHDKPGRAMAHLLALQNSSDVFSKNVSVIDLRDPNRPVLRVAETKQQEAGAILTTSATLETEE